MTRRAPIEPRCVRCGCTQSRACPVETAEGRRGCTWVLLDLRRRAGLCSACATSVELVFAHLPSLDDDEDRAGGITASVLAGYLGEPVSTVRKALAELEERGLATPVEKIGNEVLWVSPAVDEEEQEKQARVLMESAEASLSEAIVGGFLQELESLLLDAAKGHHTWGQMNLRIVDQGVPLAAALRQLLGLEGGELTLPPALEDPWVVWSFEHDRWWAPRECGYVDRLEDAGDYTQERALEICAGANLGRPAHRPNELAFPRSDAASFDKKAVLEQLAAAVGVRL